MVKYRRDFGRHGLFVIEEQAILLAPGATTSSMSAAFY